MSFLIVTLFALIHSMELISQEKTIDKPLWTIVICYWFAYSLLELGDSREKWREYATFHDKWLYPSHIPFCYFTPWCSMTMTWILRGKLWFCVGKNAHKHAWKDIPITCKFVTPLITFDSFKSLNFCNRHDTGLIIKIYEFMWWAITSFHALTRKIRSLFPLWFHNFSDYFLLCKLV